MSQQQLRPPIKAQPLKNDRRGNTPIVQDSTATLSGAAPIDAESAEAVDDEPMIVLLGDDLCDLSKALGRNILSKKDLLSAADRVTGLSVDGVSVYLEPALLSRLKSRCIHQEFPKFVQEQVIRCLREYAGL